MTSALLRLSQSPWVNVKIGALIYAFVFILMPAPMEHFFGQYRLVENHPWEAIDETISGTYKSENYSPESHSSKLTFRKVPSLIGKLTPSENLYVRIFFLFTVQLIMGLIFTILMLEWLATLTNDIKISVLMTLGFLLTHFGSSFTYDLAFFFDGMAFFFLSLAFFGRTPGLFFLGIFAALWTDERAFIGAAGVLLYQLIRNGYLNNPRRIFLNGYTFAAIFAGGVYSAWRIYLFVQFGSKIPLGPHAGVSIIHWKEQVNLMPVAWLLTFKLYWYNLVPLFVYLVRHFVLLGITVFLFVLVSLLATGLVVDLMRSTSYLFPFLLTGIYCATQQNSKSTDRLIWKMNAIWSLVIPNFRNFDILYVILPLPIRIIRMFF